MDRDYTGYIDQIQAELSAIGQFRNGRKPMSGGVAVFTDRRLPEGWVGLRDPVGWQAFGFAPQVLQAIQDYVKTVTSLDRASCFHRMIFWTCVRGFSCELLPTWEKEQVEVSHLFRLPRQINFRDPL
jgi:hypothetical protein